MLDLLTRLFRPNQKRQLTQVSSQETIPLPNQSEKPPEGGYIVKSVDDLIPVGSHWRRKPPGKQLVKVQQVWFVLPGNAPGKVPGESGGIESGWNVRAIPVHGGRPAVGHFQWFLDNFDHEENA